MQSTVLCLVVLILFYTPQSEAFQANLVGRKNGPFRINENGDEKYDFAPCISMTQRGDALESVEPTSNKSSDVSIESLPPPPCPESNKDDDIWRNIRQIYPLWVSNILIRDSGLGRLASDTAILFGIPSIISTYKEALPNLLALTDVPIWLRRHLYSVFRLDDLLEYESFTRENTFEAVQYGDHPMQVAHLMTPLLSEHNDGLANRDKLVIFIHGGAWGSGRPWMYRLVARPLLQKNCSVAVIGYRTYPDTDVNGQVEDVKLATEKLLQHSPKFAENNLTIMGHSSGSHIGLLSLLDEEFLKKVKVGSFISLAGVFDIAKHFQFETGRGVEELSPLKPACGGAEASFRQCSPTYLVQDFVRKHGSDILPKMLLVHGALDNIVPYTSTTELARELEKGIADQPSEKQRFKTLILPEVDHANTVIQFMMGGETRDLVLSWMFGKS